MPNSRELVETASDAFGLPAATVRHFMRNLREAGLVTVGGRGVTAPQMTVLDAATLICAIAGSSHVGECVTVIERITALGPGVLKRRPWRQPISEAPIDFDLRLPVGANAIADVATTLRFLKGDEPFGQDLKTIVARGSAIYVTFEAEHPIPFVSLTVGVRGILTQNWLYGKRLQIGMHHIRRCREDVFLRIALSFGSRG